ncbi:MAG: PaREP1 family protein, partial [Vulcanisaeta sp.]
LDSAANKLASIVNARVYDDWDHTYFLNVEGFHEARLDTEEVLRRLPYIEE